MGAKKISQKSKAFALYGTTKTQKEIANQIGVSDKTISKWFKEWGKQELLSKQILENFQRKLETISLDPSTPVQDIKDMVWCISQISKSITNAKTV